MENDKWALVQPGGKILKFEWDSILTMNGGLAAVYQEERGWTWIDKKGSSPKDRYFERITTLKNGLIAAYIDSLWFMYDSKGKALNVKGFDAIESLNERTVSFIINDKMGTMNSKGQIVKAPIYENIKYVSWIKTIQYKPFTPFLTKNTNQKVIDTLDFKVVEQFENHLFLVYQEGKKKLWSMSTNELTPTPNFEEIERVDDFLLFKNKRVFQIFDMKLEEFLDGTFKNFQIEGDYYFLEQTNRKWVVFDNKEILNKEFDSYSHLPLSKTFAFRINGLWHIHGIKNYSSRAFDSAINITEISKKVLLLEKEEKLALINLDSAQGRYFMKTEYQILGGGFWAMKVNKGWQILDSLGNVINHPIAELVKSFENGQFRLVKDGKWFLFNQSGKKILGGNYDFIGELKSGHRIVIQGEKYGIINSNGHFTYPMEKKYEDVSDFEDKWATVKFNGLLGKIDVNGVFKIAPHYDAFGKMTSNLLAFKFRNQWGVLDLRENIVVQPIYDKVKILNEEFTQVWKNGLTGLINGKNDLKIKCEFDSLKLNDYQLYLVYKSNKVGIYDHEGNQIRAPYFDEVKQLDDSLFALRKGDFWEVINNSGQSLMANRLDAVFFNKRLQQYILKENRDWIIEKVED